MCKLPGTESTCKRVGGLIRESHSSNYSRIFIQFKWFKPLKSGSSKKKSAFLASGRYFRSGRWIVYFLQAACYASLAIALQRVQTPVIMVPIMSANFLAWIPLAYGWGLQRKSHSSNYSRFLATYILLLRSFHRSIPIQLPFESSFSIVKNWSCPLPQCWTRGWLHIEPGV